MANLLGRAAQAGAFGVDLFGSAAGLQERQPGLIVGEVLFAARQLALGFQRTLGDAGALLRLRFLQRGYGDARAAFLLHEYFLLEDLQALELDGPLVGIVGGILLRATLRDLAVE